MSHYRAEDIDRMADDYEMNDMDDDMDDEFRGRGMEDSDSDEEENAQSVCHSFWHPFLFLASAIIIC